jgi:hypothetical protein
MKRHVARAGTLLGGFLCAIVVVMWIRSYTHEDALLIAYPAVLGPKNDVGISSQGGRVYAGYFVGDSGAISGGPYLHCSSSTAIPSDVKRRSRSFLGFGGSISARTLIIPYWGMCLVSILVTALIGRTAIRLSRRSRQARSCARCGYDLRGTSGGVCPECGATSLNL